MNKMSGTLLIFSSNLEHREKFTLSLFEHENLHLCFVNSVENAVEILQKQKMKLKGSLLKTFK